MQKLATRSRSLLVAAHRAVSAKAGAARRPRLPVFGRFAADRRGAVVVLAAILFPVVIGGLGLGVETSYWYLTERKLQHAADLAAHAGSARLRAGDTFTEIEAAALNVARESGLALTDATITVNNPPVSGAYAGDPDSVEVVLSETRIRWFTSIYSSGSVILGARAVARIKEGIDACILALSPTADGAITVSGSTQIELENCDVASNSVSASSFDMSGTGASMTTGCVYTVGQSTVDSGLTLTECPEVQENSPIVRDPYRDVPEPAVAGPCENSKVGTPNGATTVTPTYDHPSGVPSRRYCKGLDIKGNVTFEPGLYIIEGGDVTFNGGNPDSESTISVQGDGVTFYMTDTARLKMNGNVQLNLSAPTSGPFSGILFFGARDATGVSHVISGTSDSTLQGAVYAPASHIEFKGNSGVTNGCTQVVGSQVTLSGNSSLGSSCEASGTNTIEAHETIGIVE